MPVMSESKVMIKWITPKKKKKMDHTLLVSSASDFMLSSKKHTDVGEVKLDGIN